MLRFENLGGDASLDWMGRAFSESITAALAGSPSVYAIPRRTLHGVEQALGPRPMEAPGISAERAAALAAGANRIAYGQYEVLGGRLHAGVTVEDPTTGKMVAAYSASGAPADIAAVADALARRFSPSAAAPATRNAEALRQYAAAVEGRDPEFAAGTASAAIAADPNFGPPYLLLAQLRLSRQDRAGAAGVLEQALARAGAMTPVERARLELELAAIRADPAGRDRALDALARLTPADPGVWSALAQAAVARHDYKRASASFDKALAVQPEDSALLNAAGYAAAYAGNLAAAMAALRRYETLRPNEANPGDSMGDVNFYCGRFAEAEKFYLEAARKDPGFNNGGPLWKAAFARLMTGDVAGADALAKRFIEAREAAHDPLAEFRKAEWSWHSGRRRPALERLLAIAQTPQPPPLREIGPRAWAQVAIWRMELGDRAGAAQAADRAASAAGPGSAAIAAVAGFVAQPPASAGEWAVRAERAFPEPGQAQLKSLARAYALLFAHEFTAAVPVLREIYGSWNPSNPDPGMPVLLAWAYVESGRPRDAAPLLEFNPVPESTGLSAFTSLYFPRLFYLRAAVAKSEGKTAEAQKNLELYKKLGEGGV